MDILGPANAANAVTSRPDDDRTFGSLDTWWKDCTSPAANDGTKWRSAPLNSLVAQLRGLIRGNGNTALAAPVVTEDNSDGMLLASVQHQIQRGQPSYAPLAGTADVMTVTLSPAPPEYKQGMRINVRKSAGTGPNTTATPTVNVNGLGAVTIVDRNGSTLVPGDLPDACAMALLHDGSFFRADIIPTQVIRRLIFNPTVVKFTTPGLFSWTVPPGVTVAKIIAWGAGGGGGFSASSGGSGGGGGAYGEQTVTVVPGGTLSGTVGAGGAAATSIASDASSGTNTTITNSATGITYTAGPGLGGHSGNGVNNSVSGGACTNFNDRAIVGQPSGGTVNGYSSGSVFPYAGDGGASPLGGPPGRAGSGGGNPGQAPGGGGAGSGSSQVAGAGARGEVWILY